MFPLPRKTRKGRLSGLTKTLRQAAQRLSCHMADPTSFAGSPPGTSSSPAYTPRAFSTLPLSYDDDDITNDDITDDYITDDDVASTATFTSDTTFYSDTTGDSITTDASTTTVASSAPGRIFIPDPYDHVLSSAPNLDLPDPLNTGFEGIDDEALLEAIEEAETTLVEAQDTFTEAEAARLPPRRQEDLKIDYNFTDVLGTGGYAKVLTVTRKRDNKLMAAKWMHKMKTQEDVKMVEREVKIMNHLEHENICKLVESFSWRNRQVILNLELCNIDLLDFNNLLPFGSTMEPQYIKNVMEQILTGVTFMHSMGVLHRDLKMDNILLTDTGVVKITDFGLGRFVDNPFHPTDGRKRHLTARVGTDMYMAPELLLGQQDYGGEVDVWSIGVIAHDLYTGTQLNPATDDELELLRRITDYVGKIPEIPGVTPDVPMRGLNTSLRPPTGCIFGKTSAPIPPFVRAILSSSGGDDATASFIKQLLTLNQFQRPPAGLMLGHRYFKGKNQPATNDELMDYISAVQIDASVTE